MTNRKNTERAPLRRAAFALLDSYGGQYPDAQLSELRELAHSLAVTEAVHAAKLRAFAASPTMATLEALRLAKFLAGKAGDVRSSSYIGELIGAIELEAGELTALDRPERAAEADGARWPRPVAGGPSYASS